MNSGETLLGQRLGNYLIQEPLGRGGMARVYKGLDTTLKRPVAIKVIGDGFRASSSYAQRFEREAQSVANLHHPNIVNVYYFGDQDKVYYLVMEFIDGTDLDAILRNYDQSDELMPYADVMRILEAIASALDYAHGQGVIHRDVKPSNIMLERRGRPVLTDFGLALKVSEGTVGDTFGTPHYISPEQARNSADAVPQSDLYSLGVVAYEMLTGALPFDDPAPMALAMQHIMAEVPSPRAFNPQLSPEVESVLLKALSKLPADRYTTGAEFCAALRHGLEITLRQTGIAVLSEPPASDRDMPVSQPRRLSMQSALDKVDQELALQQAKGQLLTRGADSAPSTGTWGRVSTSRWLPYVIATAVVAALLLVLGIILMGSPSSPPADAVVRTEAVALVAAEVTDQPTPSPSEPSVSELTSEARTDVTMPADAAALPTSTPVSPASTPEPPTPEPPTPEPPTPEPLTPEPPTPIPPTPEPPIQELPSPMPVDPTPMPAGPTNPPPNWLPVTFVYNADGFWWLNNASRSINAQPIVFERVGGGQRFSGNRWAYWTLEPGRCMEISFSDVGNPQRPNGCRPNAFFTPTRTQGIDFWTGSGQFRVLWNGTEIAVCEIGAGQCSAFVPP